MRCDSAAQSSEAEIETLKERGGVLLEEPLYELVSAHFANVALSHRAATLHLLDDAGGRAEFAQHRADPGLYATRLHHAAGHIGARTGLSARNATLVRHTTIACVESEPNTQ